MIARPPTTDFASGTAAVVDACIVDAECVTAGSEQ